MFAITPTSSTLHELNRIVDSDKRLRQETLDDGGILLPRALGVSELHAFFIGQPTLSLRTQFRIPCFAEPKYELVLLHSKHLLPHEIPLTIYDPRTEVLTHYVVAQDLRSRKSIDTSSSVMPAFSHVREPESEGKLLQNVNVFFMVLNAAIKFRHYASLPSPAVPLPQESHDLMKSTIHLVDLLYWEPQITPGLCGE